VSQHLSCVYSMITQSQLNFAVYCVSAVQQRTCFIIMTKLLRSMLPQVILTLILNTEHLKTHAVPLSLLLFIKKKKSHYGKLILHFFLFFIFIPGKAGPQALLTVVLPELLLTLPYLPFAYIVSKKIHMRFDVKY